MTEKEWESFSRITGEPADVDAGTIEVGCNDRFEVVINLNLNQFPCDANGIGHIVFSPRQARLLAKSLKYHAAAALLGWRASERERTKTESVRTDLKSANKEEEKS